MTPADFWVRAAQWGSYMTSGDPGACMYCFDERGAVQSEEHRRTCIEWLHVSCRDMVLHREYENTEEDAKTLADDLQELDDLIEYLRTAPLEPVNNAITRMIRAEWRATADPLRRK